jgi:hypothetical protein
VLQLQCPSLPSAWRRKETAGKIRLEAGEKRNRGEREKELSKDLCANSENYRDLSVKSNFSSI